MRALGGPTCPSDVPLGEAEAGQRDVGEALSRFKEPVEQEPWKRGGRSERDVLVSLILARRRCGRSSRRRDNRADWLQSKLETLRGLTGK